MTRYVALLRAVNVGGTGQLSMAEVKALCSDAGFTRVETYIASGNVVFESKLSAAKVKAALAQRLQSHTGRPVGVIVRTAAEITAVHTANPFPDAAPQRTYVFFLDRAAPRDALDHAVGRSDEELRLGGHEIFVHYPSGMGRSKLRIPAAKAATARNMNTVAKLAAMAAKA
jgi:uncharacterized protein (DUF1697 family)